MDFLSESPREECGIIGVFAPNEDEARMTFFGLFALQHRGQEAAEQRGVQATGVVCSAAGHRVQVDDGGRQGLVA